MIREFLVSGKLIIFGLLVASFFAGFFIINFAKKIYGFFAKKLFLRKEINKYFFLPAWLLFSIILFSAASGFIKFKEISSEVIVSKIIRILYILFFGLVSIKAIAFFEFILQQKQSQDIEDFQKRQLSTQIKIIKNISVAIIIIICIALILLSFNALKSVGTTILTSAGIIGIIVGFAAQKTLNLLFAGILIAFNQPIKIGDVLIVDGEWGNVEEITLTYVVFKIWDGRRLIVPINYFVDNSFQNWTKSSTQLLGVIYIYADYTTNIDDLRKALKNILDNTPLWDKLAWGIQITDVTEHTMQIRALVSADDSSKLWDLRCLVREKLIDYLKQHPTHLPRNRSVVTLKKDETA